MPGLSAEASPGVIRASTWLPLLREALEKVGVFRFPLRGASMRPTLPVEEPWATNVYWMYGLVLDEATGMDAVAFARRLKAHGVETRPFFLGMHEQPALWEEGFFRGERYPVAERIARKKEIGRAHV